MPTYRIVIDDVGKADAFMRRSYEVAFRKMGVAERDLPALVEARVGTARAKGTVHAELADTCPAGQPNCRHCGDPAFADQCRAGGHCPDCGTKHGIAPDAVLAAHGFVLEQAD